MSITIVIPTYNRLAYLKIALNSCLNQTFLPEEIIVGDDSPNSETQLWLEENRSNWPVKLTYQHNMPGLGQAGNVEQLIQSVKTKYILLLHDDDALMPSALENLFAVFSRNQELDVVFGKQYVMDSAGKRDDQASEEINSFFGRDSSYSDRELNSMEVLLRQQLPSNSFLMKSSLAQDVHYGEKQYAGNGVDFHFCLKLCIKKARFYLVDQYVSCYRVSPDAISKYSDSGYYAYELVSGLELEDDNLRSLQEEFLKNKAPMAILQALNKGLKGKAWQIYFSKHHKNRIISLGGIRRALKIITGV